VRRMGGGGLPDATGVWWQADPARRVDHPLPRHLVACSQPEGKQLADLPCAVWTPGQRRDLPVCCHFASRDGFDDR
jgi:hypothetical protein